MGNYNSTTTNVGYKGCIINPTTRFSGFTKQSHLVVNWETILISWIFQLRNYTHFLGFPKTEPPGSKMGKYTYRSSPVSWWSARQERCRRGQRGSRRWRGTGSRIPLRGCRRCRWCRWSCSCSWQSSRSSCCRSAAQWCSWWRGCRHRWPVATRIAWQSSWSRWEPPPYPALLACLKNRQCKNTIKNQRKWKEM